MKVKWVMLLLVSMMSFLSQGIVRDPNDTESYENFLNNMLTHFPDNAASTGVFAVFSLI